VPLALPALGAGLTLLCDVGRGSARHIERRLRHFHEVDPATLQSVDDQLFDGKGHLREFPSKHWQSQWHGFPVPPQPRTSQLIREKF
jgi:hypothetical protein